VAELLTTNQLQDLLQIDRTTVYRMLKDGRLTGVKGGSRRRFDRSRVEAILNRRDRPAPQPHPVPRLVSCPQGACKAIQKVLAELAGVATLTTASTGEPLTDQKR